MEYREDLRLFQPGDQSAAILDITQLNVEHVRVLPAVGRNRRQFDTPGARQRQQRIIVVLPQGQALLVDALRRFQLRPQIGGLQVGHQIAGANVPPGIFIHQAAKELAAVGAFFANNLRAFHQRAIVDQRRPALTAGGVVFGFMEAEAADMADGAQRAPLVGGHHPLRGVFHHKQVVFVGDGHDGVHLAGYAGIMHRDNRPGFIGDGGFDERFVDIHRIATDINEDDFRPAQHKSIGGGDKGIAGHNHFVARLDIQQQRGHLQRSRAGRG